MAKFCPESKSPVLYLECNECENKRYCTPEEYIGQDKQNTQEDYDEKEK